MRDGENTAIILETDVGQAAMLRHLFSVLCGYSTQVFSDANLALEAVGAAPKPTVVIVGSVDDFEAVIMRICSVCKTSVIAIVDGDQDLSEENAFLAGAVDVVKRPYGLRALALRLRARIGLLSGAEGEAILRDATFWDTEAYIAGRANLTSAEAQITHLLIGHHGQIVSRDALSLALDSRPWDYGDRKFDVHVASIRKKLAPIFGNHIKVETVRSAGYVLTIDQDGIERLMS